MTAQPTPSDAHPSLTLVAVASTSLLVLAGWLLWLAHSAKALGAEHSFRFAPWPVVAVTAVACCAVRLLGRDEPGPTTRRWIQRPPVSALVLVALVAFLPTLDLTFLDPEDWYHLIVVRHAERHGLGDAARDAWAYLQGHPGMFIRTLHFSVWYLEDVLFHGWEPGYRLVGVAIHLGTGTLLMRLATRIGLPPAAAWIAALAFVINPASRSLVRDPTGLPELTLGLVYVAALWLWVEPSPRGARHAHPGWVRYALLVALVFTRDLAFTLPLVVAAVSFGQALDGPGAGSRGARDALGRALRVAWPACLVPLAQGLLVLGELTLDPTSGRPHPSNPMGEFGLFAEGVEVGQIAAAFLRDLPRNIVFPIWDKDPHAHLASWVVVAATVWLVAGSSATRKHLGAALGALVWVVAPMTMVFPFTTWEGPDNGHLLYLSTAGLALFIGAVWAGLPRSSARFVSTSLLAVALATSLAFHAGEIAGEKQRSALAAMANRWIDVVDSSAPDRRAVVLIGDDDAGQVRWKGALLARYARVEAWHQRYATVREAWLTDPTLAARGASPLVAGFDEDGEVTRWHGAEGPRVAGLHTAGLPPAGCEPVTIDGEETGLCSIERVARFASIREVLLTM